MNAVNFTNKMHATYKAYFHLIQKLDTLRVLQEKYFSLTRVEVVRVSISHALLS